MKPGKQIKATIVTSCTKSVVREERSVHSGPGTTDDQKWILGEGLGEGVQFPASRSYPRGTGYIIVWTERLASKHRLLRELKEIYRELLQAELGMAAV